jgi:hypothetical protein
MLDTNSASRIWNSRPHGRHVETSLAQVPRFKSREFQGRPSNLTERSLHMTIPRDLRSPSRPPCGGIARQQRNQPLTAVPPKSSRKICAPSVSHGARCTDCGLVSARPAAVFSSFPSLHEDIDCSHGIWTAFCPVIP